MSEREQNKRIGVNHPITQQSHLHAQLTQQIENQYHNNQPSKRGLYFEYNFSELRPEVSEFAKAQTDTWWRS